MNFTTSSHLKVKVIWFKNFLGLSIDQEILTKQYPLTLYYFLPKTSAWKQLESELDSKPWLNNEDKIKILKIVGDVISYWFLNRDAKTVDNNLPVFKVVRNT